MLGLCSALIFLLPAEAQEIITPLAFETKSLPYKSYLNPKKLTVVVSFDGGDDLDRWKDLLDFGEENKIKFTFFVSAAYLIPDKSKDSYIYPLDPDMKGRSNIGFGGTSEVVSRRREIILQASKAGHDIESHLVGHFEGESWTEQMWQSEFRQFNEIFSFLPTPPRHVRFPKLAMNLDVLPVLVEFGFQSVLSVDDNDFEHFKRISILHHEKEAHLIEFPIPYVRKGGRSIILMDYNFFVDDQRRRRDLKQSEDDMVSLYLEEANRCFQQKRPFFISHHFERLNQGAYRRAARRVISEIKKKFDVEFLTVSELYGRIEAI